MLVDINITLKIVKKRKKNETKSFIKINLPNILCIYIYIYIR